MIQSVLWGFSIGFLLAVGGPEGAVAATQEGVALLGTPAPEWDVTGWLNSRPLSLRALRGQVVLVRWWTGPECPYCAASAPSLVQWHEAYQSRGLVVIGFYHHKSPAPLTQEHVARLVERYGFRFPVAVDPGWQTLQHWWLEGHPHSWTSVSMLIDRRGIIRYVHSGGSYSTEEARALESLIQELLA